ncbi:hypothetical protein LJR225_003627 [Phenylobacterium sp. LjRoot225]|uniref:hypothetical protein n=1 Tax=Phenylobacterium sp. LjRoot225 TaxID=3342285 RepID=UPI003ECEF32C
MKTTEAMRELRTIADDLPAKAASAREAFNQMRRKAQDLTVQAQGRARGEIDRRRTTAATTLESLAGALRPDSDVRARRKTLAIAGGSSLALTAALGIGVALGFMMSRELKKRADQRAEADESQASPVPPQAPPVDPTTASLDL